MCPLGHELLAGMWLYLCLRASPADCSVTDHLRSTIVRYHSGSLSVKPYVHGQGDRTLGVVLEEGFRTTTCLIPRRLVSV